jgi:cytochrome c peroxidase
VRPPNPPQQAFTDAKPHDVKSVGETERHLFGERAGRATVPHRFNTPSLKSLAQTAPYLHDGSAPTLAFLLETNHDRMGATSQPSADERDALVAYLESL